MALPTGALERRRWVVRRRPQGQQARLRAVLRRLQARQAAVAWPQDAAERAQAVAPAPALVQPAWGAALAHEGVAAGAWGG